MLSKNNPIVYFCAEFGIESRLPFYAGGLGVLAGDTIKAAKDMNIPFIGISLLYRGERIIQKIDQTGMQYEEDMNFDPLSAGLEHVYFDGQPAFIQVDILGFKVWARVWKKTFSDSVVLYLLDTDTDQNQLQFRSITRGLYIGTEGTEIKQQFILGIGGIKLLDKLGVSPIVYHLNEGRPAFMHWGLVQKYMKEIGISYDEAEKLAKSKTVYTNHTLVPAANGLVYKNYLIRYVASYAKQMGVSAERMLEKGIVLENPDQFSTTKFALNISRKANGVSELHTSILKKNSPSYNWVNITNGVHMPTWQDDLFKDIDNISDDELWDRHIQKKYELQKYVLYRTGFTYDPNAMVMVWARRLAGYKRLDSLFADVERLRRILKNTDMPVQILVAGKAHLLDEHGKKMLQRIIHFMSRELSGSALFIPNYDIDLAIQLTRGSDLWINIPVLGEEACGTSGMKAISNGVLQATVPDGWAHEVDWTNLGWSLESDNVSDDLYSKLESQIVPLFYKKENGVYSKEWVKRMRDSIKLSKKYSAKRMLNQYLSDLYEIQV